jgi:phosphoglycolate phosphatase-like HAD superfamily hydrolase
MKHIMDRFNLWPYFELVVTALDVQNPKPHPESIERILQRFNLKRSEALFVGDSEIDEQAARAASIKFIAYKNREIKADGFIDDHRAILNLLPAGGSPGEEGCNTL